MLCNVCCLKGRLRLMCNQWHNSLNLVSKQLELCNIFTRRARESILELDISPLTADDVVDKLIQRSGTLYLKDQQHSAYQAYDMLRDFKAKDYTTEFERLCNKTRQYKMELPDSVLNVLLFQNIINS